MTVRIVIAKNLLPRLRGALAMRAAAEVERAARNIEADAKARVPVDTGTLRRSIHVLPTGPLSREIGPNTPYARRIEFGFNGADRLGRVFHQAGRPYLTPAAEAERPRFLDAMKRVANP